MKRYKNLNGNSGVVAYKAGATSITVQFEDGAVYLYTYASAGRIAIERMKVLAATGKGLSTYIARYVRNAYAARLR
jgi:hypothetical protein